MITEADILAALRDCYDPELPCNIVDLGLVRSVTVRRDLDAPGSGIAGVPQRHHIVIEIIPTHADEAAVAQLRAQIVNRLAGLEEVSRATVTLLSSPSWTPHDITPAGRRLLGLDGNPNLVQIR